MSHRFAFSAADTATKKKTCFICYDRDNAELDPAVTSLARRLAEDLRSRGVVVHGYIADVAPAGEWGDDILAIQNDRLKLNNKLMQESDFVLLLISNGLNVVSINPYQAEFNIAMNLKETKALKLFPILCEGSLEENLPNSLYGKLVVTFTDLSKIKTSPMDENIRQGTYENLFGACILKAFNLAPEQNQPAGSFRGPKAF